MSPMGGPVPPASSWLSSGSFIFFLSPFAVGHSLNHLLPSAWRREAALGVVLRWDSVEGGLWGHAWLHIAVGNQERDAWLSCCGLGNAKGIRFPQLTFFPRHRIPAPVGHYWPPACARLPLASCQPRPNNSHKLGRYLLGAEQPLG